MFRPPPSKLASTCFEKKEFQTVLSIVIKGLFTFLEILSVNNGIDL